MGERSVVGKDMGLLRTLGESNFKTMPEAGHAVCWDGLDVLIPALENALENGSTCTRLHFDSLSDSFALEIDEMLDGIGEEK